MVARVGRSQEGARRPREASFRQKITLVAVGLIIGLALCELILRIQEPFFHIMARHYSLPTSVEHPLWNHWPPPNINMTLAADDLEPYEIFTNSLGCRHPREVEVPKPYGIKRVLVMGDSFTEGYRYEDTIAPRLGKRLSEEFVAEQFEVINCGCTTYSPLVHYLRLSINCSRFSRII